MISVTLVAGLRSTIVVVALAIAMPLAARAVAGPPGAIVNIRWAASLAEPDRLSLETRFRLADGEEVDRHTWRYDLIDPSPDNIRALVRDPAVADTHNIDRSNGTIEPVASRTGRRQRVGTRGDPLVAFADRVAIMLAVIAVLLPVARRMKLASAVQTLWSRRRSTVQPARVETLVIEDEDRGVWRARLWTAAVMTTVAPAVLTLCLALWNTPFPVTEVVAQLEDVEEKPLTYFLIPDKAYYRPMGSITQSAIWHYGGSLDAKLASIKLLTVLPVLLLVGLFVWHVRPRTVIDAAAASLAVTVLIGSAGFRDNLELGLFNTIAGMSLAMVVWVVLSREWRIWHTPLVVACTLVAVGLKEQGLALVPLVIAAWWTRAPGASRGMAATLGTFGIVYVAFRLAWRASWLPFEQDVGLGFSEMTPQEAAARFGAFPYWVYAYSSMSTIASLLFAEPRRGVFRIVEAWRAGETQLWHVIYLCSSVGLTAVIAWWATRCVRTRRTPGRWSNESRLAVCTAVVVLAAGALSFNFSRERLAGFAVIFYAMAAFAAVRVAAARTLTASRMGFVLGTVGLALITGAWHTRAVGTIEWARGQARRNHHEWLVMLPERRVEFAHRAVYLRIMESMIEQGVNPAVPRGPRFPEWVYQTRGD